MVWYKWDGWSLHSVISVARILHPCGLTVWRGPIKIAIHMCTHIQAGTSSTHTLPRYSLSNFCRSTLLRSSCPSPLPCSQVNGRQHQLLILIRRTLSTSSEACVVASGLASSGVPHYDQQRLTFQQRLTYSGVVGGVASMCNM